MTATGKKFVAAAAKVDRDREYRIPDAVSAGQAASFAKFDETVDVAVRLGVDPRHADQVVRGTVVLPHGTGKTGPGAGDHPGREGQGGRDRRAPTSSASSTSRSSKEGWLDCDVIVATPDVMGQLGAARQDPRSPRPHAEPQGRHRHHGRGAGGSRDQGRQDRVPRRQDRQRPRPDRQGVVQRGTAGGEPAGLHRHDREGQARRPPRAPTSDPRPSPAPWGRASGSTRRGTR